MTTDDSNHTAIQNPCGEALPDEWMVEGLNAQGCQHLWSGEHDEALACFRRGLEIEPANVVTLNNLGNALFVLSRLTEARDVYLRAVEVQPNYPKSYRNLAMLYHLVGRGDEAIAAYRLYLEMEPENGEAWHNLGLLLSSEGLMDDAAEAFRVAAERLLPDDAEGATGLGVGYFFRDDLGRAVELFETALSFDAGHVPARYYLGLTRLRQRRAAEAVAELEAVLAAAPDYPQALANLGVAYNTAGRHLEAVAVFEELLRREPGKPSHLRDLAYACRDAGLDERAAECTERAGGAHDTSV